VYRSTDKLSASPKEDEEPNSVPKHPLLFFLCFVGRFTASDGVPGGWALVCWEIMIWVSVYQCHQRLESTNAGGFTLLVLILHFFLTLS
jgi:hypothetical protein